MPAHRSLILSSWIFTLALLSAVLGSKVLSSANESTMLDIIIDRHHNHIEIYIQMPGSAVEDTFAGDASELISKDGFVDFAGLRNGTWMHGASLFGKLKMSSAGRDTDLEMMSLMVHPPNRTLPFGDPIDALVATSVCGANGPLDQKTMADLIANVGFYADVLSGFDAIKLELPSKAHPALNFRLREFSNGKKISDLSSHIGDDRFISVPARAVN
ncbi:MAG: hypothetical protein AAF346_00480 [Pseudomonadota bacterium]